MYIDRVNSLNRNPLFMKYLDLTGLLARSVLCSMLGAALPTGTIAQSDITAMDIRLVTLEPGNLEVQLRPNADWSASDGVASLVFTVKWPTTMGGALGAP